MAEPAAWKESEPSARIIELREALLQHMVDSHVADSMEGHGEPHAEARVSIPNITAEDLCGAPMYPVINEVRAIPEAWTGEVTAADICFVPKEEEISGETTGETGQEPGMWGKLRKMSGLQLVEKLKPAAAAVPEASALSSADVFRDLAFSAPPTSETATAIAESLQAAAQAETAKYAINLAELTRDPDYYEEKMRAVRTEQEVDWIPATPAPLAEPSLIDFLVGPAVGVEPEPKAAEPAPKPEPEIRASVPEAMAEPEAKTVAPEIKAAPTAAAAPEPTAEPKAPETGQQAIAPVSAAPNSIVPALTAVPASPTVSAVTVPEVIDLFTGDPFAGVDFPAELRAKTAEPEMKASEPEAAEAIAEPEAAAHVSEWVQMEKVEEARSSIAKQVEVVKAEPEMAVQAEPGIVPVADETPEVREEAVAAKAEGHLPELRPEVPAVAAFAGAQASSLRELPWMAGKVQKGVEDTAFSAEQNYRRQLLAPEPAKTEAKIDPLLLNPASGPVLDPVKGVKDKDTDARPEELTAALKTLVQLGSMLPLAARVAPMLESTAGGCGGRQRARSEAGGFRPAAAAV